MLDVTIEKGKCNKINKLIAMQTIKGGFTIVNENFFRIENS